MRKKKVDLVNIRLWAIGISSQKEETELNLKKHVGVHVINDAIVFNL